MVDRDALSARLNALENYLTELRSFSARRREEFVQEPALHHLAERYLHLACETILDIAHHVIADQGYRHPASYREAIDILEEEGQIEGDLAGRLRSWIGFRNVLVHMYLEVDHGRSFDAIQQDLGDLEEFARRMARLLRDA